MFRPSTIIVGLLVALSALALVRAAAGIIQVPRPGEVLMGPDLGFRVESVGADRVIGTLVVRVNGEWVPAEPPRLPAVLPARP